MSENELTELAACQALLAANTDVMQEASALIKEQRKRIEALEAERDTLLKENQILHGLLNDEYDRIEGLEAALRIIAGYEQCIDNLMSHSDIARAALAPEQDK